jgi:hypothetical protein
LRLPANRYALTLVTLTALAALTSSAVLVGGLRSSEAAAAASVPLPNGLPQGCVKPPGGFLVIQSEYGYNDSILEGAGPSKPWPVITVTQGQEVEITVCNVDKGESHGFQINHYYDSFIVSVNPGHVLNISFMANETGDFNIYCAIFCAIHPFMQYGELRVLS